MARFTLNNFAGGLNTRMASHLVGSSEAITCLDADLTDGSITPARGMTDMALSPTLAGTVSIYKWNSAWYGSATARSYASDDYQLYYCDGGIPRKVNKSGTVTRLGMFTTGANVSLPFVGGVSGACAVAGEEFTYVQTFYSDPAAGGNGIESCPGAAATIKNNTTMGGFAGSLNTALTATTSDTSLVFLTDQDVHGLNGACTIEIGTELISGTLTGGTSKGVAGYVNTLASITRGINGTFVQPHYAGDIATAAFYQVNLQVQTTQDANATHIRVYRLFDGDYRLVTTVVNSKGSEYLWISDSMPNTSLLDQEVLTTDSDYYPIFINTTETTATFAPGASTIAAQNTNIFKAGTVVMVEDGDTGTLDELETYATRMTVASVNLSTHVITFTAPLGGSHTFASGARLAVYPTQISGPFNGMFFFWQGQDLGWTQIEDANFSNPLWRLSFPSDVLFAVPHSGMMVVGTLDGIYTITGTDPAAMSRFKVPSSIGCKIGAGMTAVATEFGVLYLSNDGITLFDGNTCQVISRAKLARSTFTGLSALFGAYHDQQYHLFHSAGEILGDFRDTSPRWSKSDLIGCSAFQSEIDDALYVGKADGKVYSYGTGVKLAYTYQTGDLPLGDQGSDKTISDLMVDCDGEVKAEIYCDGTLRHTQNIVNANRTAKHYKTSADCRGQRIQVKLTGITTHADPATVYGVGMEVSGGKSRQ